MHCDNMKRAYIVGEKVNGVDRNGLPPDGLVPHLLADRRVETSQAHFGRHEGAVRVCAAHVDL